MHWKMFFLYFSGRPFQSTSSVIISKEKSYDPVYVKSFHNRAMLLLLSRFSCVQLCHFIDGSPPGSAIPGILQARTLEWVAISFSSAWKWKVKVKSLSRVQLLATCGLQPTRLLRPRDSPGKNTGVGCHFLLQCMKVKSQSEVAEPLGKPLKSLC